MKCSTPKSGWLRHRTDFTTNALVEWHCRPNVCLTLILFISFISIIHEIHETICSICHKTDIAGLKCIHLGSSLESSQVQLERRVSDSFAIVSWLTIKIMCPKEQESRYKHNSFVALRPFFSTCLTEPHLELVGNGPIAPTFSSLVVSLPVILNAMASQMKIIKAWHSALKEWP